MVIVTGKIITVPSHVLAVKTVTAIERRALDSDKTQGEYVEFVESRIKLRHVTELFLQIEWLADDRLIILGRSRTTQILVR